MPSKSKAQQRLMGAAYAAMKNKTPLKKLSPELRKIVTTMNKQQIKEFAQTKTSELPEHKKAAAFKCFVKSATCDKTCNKNDDCNVREKKTKKPGSKVRVIESLGGSKPLKINNNKATSLNLKQYTTKKAAIKLPNFKQLLGRVKNLAKENPHKTAIGAGGLTGAGLGYAAHKNGIRFTKPDSLKDILVSFYKNNNRELNTLGAGWGTYGLLNLLGANNVVSGIGGLTAGGATYALQNAETRQKLKDLLYSALSLSSDKKASEASFVPETEEPVGASKLLFQPIKLEDLGLKEEPKILTKQKQITPNVEGGSPQIPEEELELLENAKGEAPRVLSTKDKIKEILRKSKRFYNKHDKAINSTGAGLGVYGLSRLLGGSKLLSSGLGAGAGILALALQDENLRNRLKKLYLK